MAPPLRFSTLVPVLAAVLAPRLAVASSSPTRGVEQVEASAARRVAARAGEETISMAELHGVLLSRFALGPDGRDILRHLVQATLIDHLGRKHGAGVAEGEINRLWDELDRRARGQGLRGGMSTELERRGLTVGEFRELLRLSIVQQRLTREALGLPENAPVEGEQQSIWIDQEIQRRGLVTMGPPWKDGVVASCGEVQVPVEVFADMLARHLPRSDVRESCYHILLIKGIERRMPDLSQEARERAIDAELARRRAKVTGDASMKGLSFEQLLNAQGLTLEAVRSDPSVRIAALSTLWVDRAHGEEGLRRVYQQERSWFEDRFGRSVQAYALFRRGARFQNQWNPRSFEEAERELSEMAARIGGLGDFVSLVGTRSEDPSSTARKGYLGWITRGDEGTAPAIREAIFDFLGGGGRIPPGGRILGPVRLENGAALLWLSARRDGPGWNEMSQHVHRELRRRFLREVLREEDVVTFLDE